MKPSDPQPGTSEHARLKLLMDMQDAQRRARWRAIDAKLTRAQAEIDQLLAAERAAARGQVAAEVVADPPDDAPPAPIIEGYVPPPTPAEDLDMLAASAALGSPAHLRWRERHVPNSNPFII